MPFDPTEYARKQAEKKERAEQLKRERAERKGELEAEAAERKYPLLPTTSLRFAHACPFFFFPGPTWML